MRRHETRHFRGVLARDRRRPFKVGKELIGSSQKELLKVASRLVVITPDKPMHQGMGFSCETRGNWSSREKELKVLHLGYMANTPVPPVK